MCNRIAITVPSRLVTTPALADGRSVTQPLPRRCLIPGALRRFRPSWHRRRRLDGRHRGQRPAAPAPPRLGPHPTPRRLPAPGLPAAPALRPRLLLGRFTLGRRRSRPGPVRFRIGVVIGVGGVGVGTATGADRTQLPGRTGRTRPCRYLACRRSPVVGTSPPVLLLDRPLQVAAHPLDLTARPVQLAPRAVQLAARSVQLASRALQLSPHRLQLAPRPPRLGLCHIHSFLQLRAIRLGAAQRLGRRLPLRLHPPHIRRPPPPRLFRGQFCRYRPRGLTRFLGLSLRRTALGQLNLFGRFGQSHLLLRRQLAPLLRRRCNQLLADECLCSRRRRRHLLPNRRLGSRELDRSGRLRRLRRRLRRRRRRHAAHHRLGQLAFHLGDLRAQEGRHQPLCCPPPHSCGMSRGP
eukprot:scaffold13964_cov117-Isochrysis_galbana.AAC.5